VVNTVAFDSLQAGLGFMYVREEFCHPLPFSIVFTWIIGTVDTMLDVFYTRTGTESTYTATIVDIVGFAAAAR
jgi:hypothetical protein